MLDRPGASRQPVAGHHPGGDRGPHVGPQPAAVPDRRELHLDVVPAAHHRLPLAGHDGHDAERAASTWPSWPPPTSPASSPCWCCRGDGRAGRRGAALGVALVAMAGGLAAAMAVGALMGWLIAYVEVPAMLATLAMMTLLNGVNVVITKGYTLSGFPEFLLAIGNGMAGSVPIPFYVFLVVCLVAWGSCSTGPGPASASTCSAPTRSPPATPTSDVRAVLVRTYVLSSAFAALTAFVMMGQLNSVKANYAESYLLVSVLACFLGGVDPIGGGGTLSGMVLAVVILQVVSTGVNLLRVDPFFVQAHVGLHHPGPGRRQLPRRPPQGGPPPPRRPARRRAGRPPAGGRGAVAAALRLTAARRSRGRWPRCPSPASWCRCSLARRSRSSWPG